MLDTRLDVCEKYHDKIQERRLAIEELSEIYKENEVNLLPINI